MRDLPLGGGKWSGLTFKHVLLPLWVGTYHFQGKDFRLLVNGQTGKVSGKKPRDHVKAVALTVMAFLIAVIFLILLYFMWLSIGRAGVGG